MPARTHGVKVVFLVLCLGLFVLQSGCSTSGGGNAEAPPSNANALHLTLSAPSGSTTVVIADVQSFRANIVITFVPDVPALVQLTASPTTVSPAGTATLTATVTDVNGNHVSAGETVTFSLSTNTSGATLSAVSGVTNSSGQATVKYTAGGMPGADTVQAQVTSTVVGFASITVTESQNLSHVTGITAVASAPSVVADGTSTVAIRATVTTASGFSPAGLVVTFTTTLGAQATA